VDDPVVLGCIPKVLPPHLQVVAAWHSVLANAENLPHLAAGPLMLAGNPQIAQRMAVERGKYWPNGSKIGVEFLGGSTEIQDRVMAQANAWARYANVDFVAVARGKGQVRVSFDLDGYWSYIGTDALAMPPGEPTLNLQWFDRLTMPDSEWIRVPRHEFGHVLGALHEQQRPEVVARLDPAKVIPAFERSQGWPEQEIRNQILIPFSLADTIHTELADEHSLMEYFFDGSLTYDGQPIVGGADISEMDKRLISQVYPGRWTPDSPPPSPPPVKPPDPPDDLKEVWRENVALLNLHNKARAAAGRKPLTIDWRLAAAAVGWADEMARLGTMTHVAHGSDPWSRIKATGYPYTSSSNVQENAGVGTPRSTDAQIMKTWLKSPGHRRNVLSQVFVHMGVGKTTGSDGRTYWCVDFGVPR
jgi:uncharacterized protein YkwD